MLLRSIKIVYFVLALTMGPTVGWGDEGDSTLAEGLSQYQAGKYDEAIQILSGLLNQQPENSQVIYNLGLAQFKAGRVGLAMGLWRKALSIHPGLSEARAALNFASAKVSKAVAEGDGSFWDLYRDKWISRISWNLLSAGTALFLFGAGWVWLGFIGRRRRALLQEAALPSLPKMGIVFGLGFVVFAAALSTKFVDALNTYATVTSATVEAKTGPGETHATLFELFEGALVTVRASDNGWAQVRSSSGRVGWVKADMLYVSSGSALW